MKHVLRKRGLLRGVKRALAFVLVLSAVTVQVSPVYAETLSDIKKKKEEAQQQKKDTQDKLDKVQSSIESMAGEQEEMEAELEEIDAEFVDLILSIDVLEVDIRNKNEQITVAQQEYDDAKATEEAQHQAMNRRIKFMYEKGDTSYLTLMLQSQSIADLVNKVDYTERLYDYDRRLLEEYQQTKEDVLDKKEALEVELSEMEEMQADMEEQKAALAEMIEEKKATLEDFDDKLQAAKKQANDYKAEIKKQSQSIKAIEQEEAKKKAEEEAKKKAEEEARKKAEAEAKKKAEGGSDSGSSASSSSGSSGSSSPVDPGDSSKGAEIASYACQFVGGPYVPGGTSLTEGCDCSGFTSSVYSHFGISLPRSSYAQSAAGREVSYSDVQPGDILYYGGHVAIYVGNNTIVHASTQATGIKYSSAFYRTIITIRRFV